MCFCFLPTLCVYHLLIDGNDDMQVGWTPLHVAAKKGHLQVVELLVAKGADVEAKDKVGAVAFSW